MELELVDHQKNIEQLVKERADELDKKNMELGNKNNNLKNFNRLFTDREFRIKELKEK